MKKLPVLEKLILLLLLLFLGYLYVGFYHPDPYLTEGSTGSRARILLWGIRILFPLLVIIFLNLYVGARTGRYHRFVPWVVAMSIVAALWLFYPVANYFYVRWYEKNLHEYHPYLQLVPQEPRITPEERDSRFLIISVGGSTTEFADSSGKDWEERVETLLKPSHPNVKVCNEGRQWYTTLHTLINYETNLRQYHPRMLIVMQSLNDLLHNADFSYFSKGAFREDYGHFYGPVNRLVKRRSLLDYLSRTVKDLWYHKPRTIVDTGNFPGLVPYERNLRTLIELAQHDSTKVVLMTEPSLFKDPSTPEELNALFMLHREAIGPDKQWSLQTAIRGMNDYNDVMRKLAAEYGLVLIDLEKHVPKSLLYFRDEVHYTTGGFDLIAPYIAEEIEKHADQLFQQ